VVSIEALGWDSFFAAHVLESERSSGRLARVVDDYGRLWRIDGEADGLAEMAGRLRRDSSVAGERPVVGDWVLAAGDSAGGRWLIQRIVPRRTAVTRVRSGSSHRRQVLAANIDTMFVVTSFNEDLSANRIERYLAIAWNAGAVPVVVVNKRDLVDDPEVVVGELRERFSFVDVHAVSALQPEGVAPLAAYLLPGRTAGLVGSSGVGKSSVVNCLLGHRAMDVRPIREADGKGRHTTSNRTLVRLAAGGLLIDTPGMRELQPAVSESALQGAFADIDLLAASCRFADCGHHTEPGCAVLSAVSEGRLGRERLDNYRRIAAEGAFERRKHDKAAAAESKRQWKQITRAQREMYKRRSRD
jgi:ribosome biogenesis GTPase / thiamine phosphate phosphatase